MNEDLQFTRRLPLEERVAILKKVLERLKYEKDGKIIRLNPSYKMGGSI